MTNGPWKWTIEDYSTATLHGPNEIEDYVMSVSPCNSCQGYAEKEGKVWKWGRCITPSLENALILEKSWEMLKILRIIANTQYRTNKEGKVDPIEIDQLILLAKNITKEFDGFQ